MADLRDLGGAQPGANAGGASGNSNIRVSGGTITTEGETGSVNGKHMGFNKVKGLSIDNVRMPKIHAGWNVFCRDCEDVAISNVTIGNGAYEDDELTDALIPRDEKRAGERPNPSLANRWAVSPKLPNPNK